MEIQRMIDHTLLKPETTEAQIRELCKEAIQYDFKSVCVPPRFVSLANDLLQKSNTVVCTVVGFPLGYQSSGVKAFEAGEAISHGAAEIDMVIAIGALKEKNDAYLLSDIRAVRDAIGKNILKVIIETCLLSEEEIERATRIAVEAGADFIKTSTGFSTGGATTQAVTLMKKTVGDRAKIKASGGIRDANDALSMIDAGAERLGTSSGVKIVETRQ